MRVGDRVGFFLHGNEAITSSFSMFSRRDSRCEGMVFCNSVNTWILSRELVKTQLLYTF